MVSFYCQASLAAEPSCEQQRHDAVFDCLKTLDKAEQLHTALEVEVSTYKKLVSVQDKDMMQYQLELNKANAWYRQPAVVAPVTALATLILLAPLLGR